MKRLVRWGFSLVLVTSLVGCAHRSARYCGPYRSHCEGLFDVLCHHHANDWGKCKRGKRGRCGTCDPCGPVCGPTCPPGCQPSFPGVPAYPLPTYGPAPAYGAPGYGPPAYGPPAAYPAPQEYAPYEAAPAEQPVPEPMESTMMPMQNPGSYGPYMAAGAVDPNQYPQMQHQPYPAYDAGSYPSTYDAGNYTAYDAGGYPQYDAGGYSPYDAGGSAPQQYPPQEYYHSQNCQNCDLQSPTQSGPVQMSPPVSPDTPVPAPPADLQSYIPGAGGPAQAQAPATSYWQPTAQPQNIAPFQDASAIPQQGIYRR